MPYCIGPCMEPHDTQFDIEMELQVGVSLRLQGKAGWPGTRWHGSFDLMWWAVLGGQLGITLQATHTYTPLLAANLHLLSMCYVMIPSLLPGYKAPCADFDCTGEGVNASTP